MPTTGLYFHALFLIPNYLTIFLCTSRKKKQCIIFYHGQLHVALQVECMNLVLILNGPNMEAVIV